MNDCKYSRCAVNEKHHKPFKRNKKGAWTYPTASVDLQNIVNNLLPHQKVEAIQSVSVILAF